MFLAAVALLAAGCGMPRCVRAETNTQAAPADPSPAALQKTTETQAFDSEGIIYAVKEIIALIVLSEQLETNIISCPTEERNAIRDALSLKKTRVEMLVAPMTQTDMDAFNKEFQRQNLELFLLLTEESDSPSENKQ